MQCHSFSSPPHRALPPPQTGELRKLQVDFKEYIDDLGSVYDLYKVENPRAATNDGDAVSNNGAGGSAPFGWW